MKVQVTHYRPGLPEKSFYQRGVDYLRHEFDLEFADTLGLLKELKDQQGRLEIDTPSAGLEFYIAPDNSLWVEIYGENGLWAISEIDLGIGEEILRIAYQGGDLGEQMPTTNRTWDAYSGI
jgi:hypothetical protein